MLIAMQLLHSLSVPLFSHRQNSSFLMAQLILSLSKTSDTFRAAFLLLCIKLYTESV